MQAGRERLKNLTEQLGTMFGQSAQSMIKATHAATVKKPVQQYLLTQQQDLHPAVQHELENFLKDTSTTLVSLLDKHFKPLLSFPANSQHNFLLTDSVLFSLKTTSQAGIIGKFYHAGDTMYHPVIVPVMNNKLPTGYLVRWRRVTTNPKTIQQLSGLLGTGATLFFGNQDGSFWTDLLKPVAPFPAGFKQDKEVFEFTNQAGNDVLATIRPVSNTNWLIMVEFSKQKILSSIHQSMYWIILIGAVLIIAGMIIAWFISRSITKPLNYLTNAASAIASGNDHTLTEMTVRGNDELSKLGQAFNYMTRQVKESRQNLEYRINQRTQQLQAVNKELESFSYSVSHDLRAPLRAINGYSNILEEDYSSRLDKEGLRLLGVIRQNATRMGTLIDDLLSFSRLSKQEIKRQEVDMHAMVQECLAEIIPQDLQNSYQVTLKPLPKCLCDKSMIRQVWCNLIGNAVKYSSQKKEKCIEIGSSNDDPHKQTYYIIDNGAGFNMKYSDKLFGIFQRLHSDTEFEGTGVGLALVKRILNKHDGDIWAQSTPGLGATFHFNLPKSIP